MPINVWVTGAGGFVGRRVVHALSQMPGVTVHGLRRGDALGLNRPADLMQAMGAAPDLVIDLAWSHLDDYGHPAHIGSQLALHAQFYRDLIDAGVGDIAGIGTAAEYGVAQGALTERQIASPVSPYAVAKHRLRTKLESVAVAAGVRWRWIRLFNVWGEGQPGRTLFGQVCRLREDATVRLSLTHPNRRLDYLAVDEVAFRIAAMSMQRTVTGVINCGSGVPVELKALVERWLIDRPGLFAQVNWLALPVDDASAGYWAEPTRMNEALVAFHEGR